MHHWSLGHCFLCDTNTSNDCLSKSFSEEPHAAKHRHLFMFSFNMQSVLNCDVTVLLVMTEAYSTLCVHSQKFKRYFDLLKL